MLTGHSPLAAQRDILTASDDATRELGHDTDAPKLGSTLTAKQRHSLAATSRAGTSCRWNITPSMRSATDIPSYQPFHETHRRRMV
jgi:hypothetical protein